MDHFPVHTDLTLELARVTQADRLARAHTSGRHGGRRRRWGRNARPGRRAASSPGES